VQQFNKQKEANQTTEISQQLTSSHTPLSPVSMVTVVTNSDSSHVNSDSLATPPNGHNISSKPFANFNQSDQIKENVSQSQHSDISLASLSSGLYNLLILILYNYYFRITGP